MTIDETGLNKGLVRKLNALRKSVGDDLAEEVFAKWLEREVTSQAKGKPDPVAMKIVETLAGFKNDPKFNLGNYGYTVKRLSILTPYRRAILTPLSGTAEVVPVVNRGDPRGFV